MKKNEFVAMTNAEMLQFAASNGLSLPSNSKKADIIAAVEAANVLEIDEVGDLELTEGDVTLNVKLAQPNYRYNRVSFITKEQVIVLGKNDNDESVPVKRNQIDFSMKDLFDFVVGDSTLQVRVLFAKCGSRMNNEFFTALTNAVITVKFNPFEAGDEYVSWDGSVKQHDYAGVNKVIKSITFDNRVISLLLIETNETMFKNAVNALHD